MAGNPVSAGRYSEPGQVVAAGDAITLTASIVVAYVANNEINPADVAHLIATVHVALRALRETPAPDVGKLKPAVPIGSSVRPNYIVCLEDGKMLKTLRQHLRTRFQMSPDEYRAKWGLPADYPMVAPNYAVRRRELALRFGLGRLRI